MATLQASLLLQRAPNLRVLIHSPTDIQIDVNGSRVNGGMHALSILETFEYPIAFAKALESLQSRCSGAESWMQLTTVIRQFYDAGILVEGSGGNRMLRSSPFDWDAAPNHVSMLNDRSRTESYLRAIERAVRPDDVVLEIGTGTGVLAIAAARAGARHVYTIEASGIANAAERMFEANGVDNRITLVRGWSSQVSLPERADLLISEIIGNHPLGEGVLEATHDALRRHLKPDARLLPCRIRIFGIPVTIPDSEMVERTFEAANMNRWNSWYGIDFSPLHTLSRNAAHMFFIRSHRTTEWRRLAEPVLLAEIDLEHIEGMMIQNTVEAKCTAAGRLNGVIVYFELDLDSETSLSIDPATAGKSNSWRNPVWVVPEPIDLSEGESFSVTHNHRVPGKDNSVTVSRLSR